MNAWPEPDAAAVPLYASITAPFHLEKSIWTEADFERMGWHDAALHAFAVLSQQEEVVFDIDYIFQWIHPVAPVTQFSFCVAPATLVFHKAYQISINLETHFGDLSLNTLLRQEEHPTTSGGTDYLWVLESHEGEITLRASGFTQYIRRPPILTQSQTLALEQRGGPSFERSAILDLS